MAASGRDVVLIIIILAFVSANSHIIHDYRHGSRQNLQLFQPAEVDIEALQTFKRSITYDASNALANWEVGNYVCNWTGVTCHSKKLRVISLNLYNMSLQGTIPPHLGNMSFLGVLNLTFNLFFGAIPPELGRLRRIKLLLLKNNNLTSSIPESLKGCTALTELLLSYNNLTGSIPSDLGQLQKLQKLRLYGNRLSGKLPDSLGNCSAMVILDLGSNFLSGTIPSQLGMLTRIQGLSVGENQMSGGIPPSLLNCSDLRSLYLYDNRLVGEIPSEIGTKLWNLETLLLWGNELNTTVPKSLGNCSQLLKLELSQNLLTGGMPQEFGKLRQLQSLMLDGNQLVSADSISIFESLSNCTNLQKLALSINDLKGDLPGSIGQLSQKLFYLYLHQNRFTGKIPQQISNLTGLVLLTLNDNLLTGSFPSALGALHTLQMLDLSQNNLEDTIPYELSQLNALNELYLSKNMFSGNIPQVFGSLQQLRKLDLSYNKFSGNIPDSIGQSSSLELLDLSYNQLTGMMPLPVASLRELLFYINVSHNALTGRLPAQIGGMQMVQAIDLSANNISGNIPDQIIDCAGLEYLNLSHNSLEGTIPASIGQLVGLEDMDFSFNLLSGSLPISMEKLRMLRYLNLSYNNFTGEIPNSGAFRDLNFTSFLGNAGLCGRWIELPPCKLINNGHHDSKRKMVILATSIASVSLFILCVLVGTVLILCLRRRKSASLEAISTARSWPLRKTKSFSWEEVNRATQGFSPDSLLGRGGHGSVYKGILDDGAVIAVKVFQSTRSGGAYRKLVRECKTLGRVKHRNLVRIMGVCSTLQVKSLVMEFMSQGSLDKHLHYTENNSKLGLKRRLRILKEVAHGMAYLHHHCSPAIVHCDLKPSNVLLDETMTVHVGDFGISHLMIPAAGHDDSTEVSGDTSSLVIGSIGYTAPEYGLGGRVSTKGDVYSYGMLMLEMITGKKPTDPLFSEEVQSDSTLQSWVGNAIPERLLEVIDRDLMEEIREKEDEHVLSKMGNYAIAVLLAEIGLRCSKEAPHNRPTLREVEALLEKLESEIQT